MLILNAGAYDARAPFMRDEVGRTARWAEDGSSVHFTPFFYGLLSALQDKSDGGGCGFHDRPYERLRKNVTLVRLQDNYLHTYKINAENIY